MAADMAGEMATDAVKPMSDRLTVILPPAASAEELALADFEFHCGNLAHGNGRGAGCYHGPTGWGDGTGDGEDIYSSSDGDGWGDGWNQDQGRSDGYGWFDGRGGSNTHV